MRSHDVLSGLNSIKFLEILNSNKTPNIFSTYQFKITFKPLNFVRKPFLMCFKIRTPLGIEYKYIEGPLAYTTRNQFSVRTRGIPQAAQPVKASQCNRDLYYEMYFFITKSTIFRK